MNEDEIRKLAAIKSAGEAGILSVWVTFTRGILFWPAFTMAGWGIGLILHGFSVFVSHGQWEENEIEKEVRRLKKKSGQS
jgi:hypothetical protein